MNMSLLSRTVIALAASSLVASTALAQPLDLQGGGNGPAKVKEVKLSLSGVDKGCPDEIALITRVETTGPGNFKIRYRKAGGGKSDLITVQAVKTQNGKYVAKHVQAMNITQTTDTKYMVESGAKISPWVAVKKNCALVLDPGIIGVPKKVLSAQLGIKGPKTNVCPNEATTSGWVVTDFEGPLQVMIARKGQGVGAPFVIQAKKAANGKYMASFTKKVPILAAVDAEYRLLVGGGSGVMSNWVRLKATCAIGLPGLDLAPGG
jgi:hypothetical protein